MVDEYELVSKKELDELRKKVSTEQAPTQETRESEIKELDRFAKAGESAKIIYLNNNVEKLNHSLKRLLMLFDQAHKEMVNQGPAANHDGLQNVMTQNEKIASGLISIANMIRDQQIQLNQMNILYRQLEGRLDEIRLQRRITPTSYKIPKISEPRPYAPPVMPKEAAPLPERPPAQPSVGVEVDTGPKIGQQIMQEEQNEKYATFDMFNKPEEEEPELPDVEVEPETEQPAQPVPPPPPPPKKGFLKHFARR